MTAHASAAPSIAIPLDDLAATGRLAARLAGLLRPGDVVALGGDLGAGKTAFARALIQVLARAPVEVPSPTFTLVQSYDTAAGTVWHFDLYRLNQPEEAYELGIEEAFEEGISLIEWPDRLGALLPVTALRLDLLPGETEEARVAVLTPASNWVERLKPLRVEAERLARMANFLESAGWGTAVRRSLAGDASFRRYFRLHREAETAVLMDAPPPHEDVRPFVAIDDWLTAQGYSAPRILARDVAAGFLLLEDLGDDLYTRLLARGGDEEGLYAAAVDLLADLHTRPAPDDLAAQDLPRLLEELDLVLDWYMPALTGQPTSDDLRAEYRALWQAALPAALCFPPVLVLRDYHADNLLWLPDRAGLARVGLLDFQDALAGAPAYDLVSLLEDARRDVPPDLAERMLARYIAARGLDAETFRLSYAVLGAQRNARIVGLWPRLWKRDGKPQYLQFMARTWGLLERDLAHPALADLRAWFDRAIPPAVRRQPLPGAP